MSKQPKLLVSIINWNNNSATSECLKSIAHIPKSEQPDIRLIDNDSREEPFDIPKAIINKLRKIEIVKNDQNIGFAKAHNQSIKHAVDKDYDYICILNNDTVLVDEKVFDELIEALGGRTIASVPTIMNQNGNIWYAGGKFNKLTSTPSHSQSGLMRDDAVNHIETQHLTGCCMMINLSLLKKHKLFLPEKYFMYWEDVEWSLQARQKGLELAYVPDAQIIHTVSSSLGIRSPTYIYYIIRNNILFIKRNTTWYNKPLSYLKVLSIDAKYEIKGLLGGWQQFKKVESALLEAWGDGLRNRGGRMKGSDD